jgi:hypothetical protein
VKGSRRPIHLLRPRLLVLGVWGASRSIEGRTDLSWSRGLLVGFAVLASSWLLLLCRGVADFFLSTVDRPGAPMTFLVEHLQWVIAFAMVPPVVIFVLGYALVRGNRRP